MPEIMMSEPNVNYGPRDIALTNQILRVTVGSGVHGIAIEGTDDNDEMGIFIEPRSHVYGTLAPIDNHIWRTQPEGARSGPGDTDQVFYSLRKYLRLAGKGNPTALLALFAPAESVLMVNLLGKELRGLRDQFLTKESVHRFLGYMRLQHEQMLGGGKRNRVPTRPELIERYGWDVKYGAHALRLAIQGLEVVSFGRLTLPMPEFDRQLVLAVKRGEVPRDRVSKLITLHTAAITETLPTCDLPESPDWELLNRWSIRAHESWWQGRRI